MLTEDTIAAIATAPGEGGIGIVRISGELAETILRSVFVPRSGIIEGRKLTFGHIVDDETGEIIDEVLAVIMKGPHTYTTEDVAEINCHGSSVSLRKTLELVLKRGARLAEPGEFTKRAFLGGRIDLSQAEAVIDLIRAKSEHSYKAALGQLSGRLSEEISSIRAKLVDILVDIAVNIDYPDEDIELISYEKTLAAIKNVEADIRKLSETGHTGRILREGLNTVIVGKPNVGKSSLMNRLLRETRAIVTEIPGTTRDTIEEHLNIGGILINITDTAGIRETDDVVEKIGVEKSRESLKRADLVLFLVDSTAPIGEEDREIMQEVTANGSEVIVLLNKSDSDESKAFDRSEIEKTFGSEKIIETSMINGLGIDVLENRIQNMVYNGDVTSKENVLITDVRHLDLINKALALSEDAISQVEMQQPFELIEIDVNDIYMTLGEITGEAVREDIINEVFSRFCLGK